MKLDDFLITTSVGDVSRKFTWTPEESKELDLPRGWVIEKVDDKLRVRDGSLPTYQIQIENAFTFEVPEEGGRQLLDLPSPENLPANRPLAVEIVRMKALKPVYVMGNMLAPSYPTAVNKQLTLFYGQRYFLVHFRPVSGGMNVKIGNRSAFDYGRTPNGYWITAQLDGMKIKFGGKRASIPVGLRFEITEQQFFSATIIVGVHWWRFRMVPTPDSLPPIESDETEDQIREKERFRQSVGVFSIFFAGFMLVMTAISLSQKPPPKIIATNVELKTPKIIPPSPNLPKPTPAPIPTPEPPKVAVKEPEPPKPKPEPVKPKPEKKVAAKKPTPKKVASQPPPKAPKPPPKSPEPPPPPAKVVKQEPVSNAGAAAAQHAADVQAQQQQLAAKLGFLSTSSKKAAADPSTYESKSGKFTNTPTMGGLVSKSNSLDKVVKGATGDGRIRTNSARSVASDVSFGDRKGKGLNDVQGKVSEGELAAGGAKMGDSLGGGSLNVSGPGTVSDGEIEKALAKFMNRFQFCYEKALLSNASLGGNVIFQWSIGASGKAQSPKVVSSQLNSADLHACMTKVLNEIPFPKPKGGSVIVKKTFSFSSSSL